MTSHGITLDKVTKSYGRNLVLEDVTTHLAPGKIYGLLGANGTGKTTLMSLICTHIFPTSGTITIDGENPQENAKVLSQLCFVHEDQHYNDSFKLSDIVKLMSAFYPTWDTALAEKLIARFRLPLKTLASKMSRGQRSALAIVLALASRTPYTFLDEPYLGLDATAREIFYDALIETYAAYPRTFILSTHLIDEASDLMEEVLVLNGGRIVLQTDVDQARSSAFIARGLADDVLALAKDRPVLTQRPLGRVLSATIEGSITDDDRIFAEQTHISLEAASLQELIAAIGIHELTEEGVK